MIESNLRVLMAKKKVNQEDVINDTKLSKMTVNKLFHGKATMYGKETLDKLCKYFNCTVSDILEYIPDSPDKGT
jgi:putative transcriptional regulator